MIYKCDKCKFECMSKRLFEQHMIRCESDLTEREERSKIAESLKNKQSQLIGIKRYGF